MTPTATALAGLRSQRPEWAPWLAVVEETLREPAIGAWDAAVPTSTRAPGSSTPLLAGATGRAGRERRSRPAPSVDRCCVTQWHTANGHAAVGAPHRFGSALAVQGITLSGHRGDRGHGYSVRCGRRRSRSGDRARSACHSSRPATAGGRLRCHRVGKRDIVPCAARGRHLPKCVASSGPASSGAAAAAAGGMRVRCAARTAAWTITTRSSRSCRKPADRTRWLRRAGRASATSRPSPGSRAARRTW